MIVFKLLTVFMVSVCKLHSQTVLTDFAVKTLKCDTLYGEILRTSSVRYFPQCVRLCEINGHCQSILFNELNGTCQANRNLLSTGNVTQECGETLKYAERRKGPTSTPGPISNAAIQGQTSTPGPKTTAATLGTTSTPVPTTTAATLGTTSTTVPATTAVTLSTTSTTVPTTTAATLVTTSTPVPTTTAATPSTTSTTVSTTTASTLGTTTTDLVIKRSLIEKACFGSSSCTVIQSSCINGVCKCLPGYSYDSGIVLCVANCGMYGRAFQFHPNSLLANHNDRTLTGVSEYECTEECIDEELFKCRSLDYYPASGLCFLSSETAASQPDAFTTDVNVIYRQRDCF